MSYATISDLADRTGDQELRQIADRDRDMLPDQPVVDAALIHADNLIDGYIGAKYALPLAVVPDLLRTWAVSIARHFLHRNGAPDHVSQDYKDALTSLKDVAAGRMALPIAQGSSAPAPATAGGVMAAHPDEVFTSDRLRGW